MTKRKGTNNTNRFTNSRGQLQIQIYLAKCLKIHNHIASKFCNHANCIFKTLILQTSKLHCIFLACFCHLGLNCMHENRTGAVFIHLLNVFALSLQIQYKSSHWVYNCDYHRPALICPDMSPRADKVLCKKHFRNMNKKSIKLNSCQTLHYWLSYFTFRDG